MVGDRRKWPYTTPRFKDFIWTLVSNARGKDGGKREEESCGAGTGMQMYSLTRWFLLVGVRTVGGQFRGALTYACKQGKDFSVYCVLSREGKVAFKTPFLSYSSKVRHSYWVVSTR